MNSIMPSLLAAFLLLLFTASSSLASSEVTVTGQLVDLYCWENLGGRALDTGANLFADPTDHTVHCMIDVSACLRGGFAIVERPDANSQWAIKYRLDALGNTYALEQMGKVPFSQKYDAVGYTISIPGTINPDGSFTTGNVSTSSGAGGSAGVPVPTWVAIHAALAAIGFGLLMPTGMLIPIFMPRHQFLQWHMACVVSGLLCGGAAFGLALYNVGGILVTDHGRLGAAIIALSLFQVIVGACRPHKAEVGEEPTQARKVFEMVHPNIGRALHFLIGPQIILGYSALNIFVQSTFILILGYIHGLGIIAAFAILVLAYRLNGAGAPEQRDDKAQNRVEEKA